MIAFYRIFFPFIFLFFLPGLILKLIRRSGWKKTYAERFGFFSNERKKELAECHGAVWFHAVSVGEVNLALNLIREWAEEHPDKTGILSTTTTTAQEIARQKAPANVHVIFCPIDSALIVGRVLNLLRPSALVIFETELWPNLILMAKHRGIRLAMVNARISDRSFRGYYRFRAFFAPILDAFHLVCAQTARDMERLETIMPDLRGRIHVTGNIKFDQQPPEGERMDFREIFHSSGPVVLAASTHNPEEALILDAFQSARRTHPNARLVLVPRHAERGAELEKLIQSRGFRYLRRSTDSGDHETPDILLADTTGELTRMIQGADLILMGKTFAGNDEGQNIIEPAILGKAIICGPKLRNFRQALELLKAADGVLAIDYDAELAGSIHVLLTDSERRFQIGDRARIAMLRNRGALHKTLQALEELLCL